MKLLMILLLSSAILTAIVSADSKVVLTNAFRPVETTIPGEFKTLEAILPALFTLADQAADKGAEQNFIGGRKKYKDLIYYYRGVRVSENIVTVMFSKGAKPYFSGGPSFDTIIMHSIIGTVKLYKPKAKEVKIEIEGKIWRNNDG
ncbi:hypothetical protein HW115_01435 [Verrucomicrobiaceae bacterium N1E253]|uniref:DUF3888 domain-containing protein n=1 Tax=Oceaniferula marina TaxID=2748318 RepID=A0A851GGI4_9BACT|nr:hypothetical protein [Oceaniferula marina]NWK54257.1 hypothetical protein [Oceaniferula marina]